MISTAPQRSAPAPVARRRRALLVEDAADLRELLTLLLEDEGFEVVVAADGAQALAALDEVEPTTLVVVDYHLPRFDGLQVLRRLRARAGWAAVPALLLSGDVAPPDAGTLPFVTFVAKPCELDVLLAWVTATAGPGGA